MKIKEQNINDKEFKWSAKHNKFILQHKIKKHIQWHNTNKHSNTYAKWGQKQNESLQNNTQYRLALPFARLQKSHYKYVALKSLSGLEISPKNK